MGSTVSFESTALRALTRGEQVVGPNSGWVLGFPHTPYRLDYFLNSWPPQPSAAKGARQASVLNKSPQSEAYSASLRPSPPGT